MNTMVHSYIMIIGIFDGDMGKMLGIICNKLSIVQAQLLGMNIHILHETSVSLNSY